MFFVATRDILAAFVLTILYIIIIDGLLHEKRKFCIIPKKYLENITKKDVTQQEMNQYLQAKQIVMAFELNKSKQVSQESINKSSYETYVDNLKLLNNIPY